MPEPNTHPVVSGGVRRLSARWVIDGTLRAVEPLHLGSGDEGTYVDMELLRDRPSNAPKLPGSSLAGGLRDYLCRHLAGDRAAETAAQGSIAALFGGRPADPDGSQSPLIVFDSVGRASTVETRDHVRINPTSGTAERGGKFDMEAWGPGTSFEVRFDFIVPDTYSPSQELDCLAHLATALRGFADDEVVLGAKGARGFGRCRLEDLRATRYPLGADSAAWKRYLATGLHDERAQMPQVHATGTAFEAIIGAWPEQAAGLRAAVAAFERACAAERLTVSVDVECPGGILIRGAESGIAGADAKHIESGGQPVITGTGLAGAMRQRARRIAAVVRGQGNGDRWVSELFGTEPQRSEGRRLTASRVAMNAVPMSKGRSLQVTRIKLDRFTQAPVDGALLQEEPVYRGRTTVVFRVRLPGDRRTADAVAGLFMLTLKDLLLGDVPVGGTVGVGRGVLRQPRRAGALRIHRSGGEDLVWEFGTIAPDGFRTSVEGWVRALHDRTIQLPAADTEVIHA